MTRSLVIVESPTKAKSIGGFLRGMGGDDVVVEASMGHIRDLPGSAKDLPEKYRKEPWAYLAVNVDDDFDPVWVLSKRSRDQVKKLKKALEGADEVYLATDEDREGDETGEQVTTLHERVAPGQAVPLEVAHDEHGAEDRQDRAEGDPLGSGRLLGGGPGRSPLPNQWSE